MPGACPGHDEFFSAAHMDKLGELTSTIRQFAAFNCNVERTARLLDLHANTGDFRLTRIRDLTRIDSQSFAGPSLLMTTVRVMGAGDGSRQRDFILPAE
jgi:sugar diacid utilization regulator